MKRIKNAKRLAVTERRDRVLRWFQQNTSLGEGLEIFVIDRPKFEPYRLQLLAWSESYDESDLVFLLGSCVEDGLLKHKSNRTDFYLTPKGYRHLEKLNGVAINFEQAFVAMWFDESMANAYAKGIEPAIRAAGYRPLRIDQKQHINRIDDEIIAEIRRSRFVVADFTSNPDQPRGGVYFEAGSAYGLGLPVIWTCREDVFDKVHFDTRQFNHIVWSTRDDLFKDLFRQLKNRIEAVIGEGPLKQ